MTDWNIFWATLGAGILTAISTISAVVYTHHATKKELQKQELKFTREREEENRTKKFITIRTKMLLNTFDNLLDRLLVDNDYNRCMLFSGTDGFSFYDDYNSRATIQCRLLMFDNPGIYEIRDLSFQTKSILKNLRSNQIWSYETNNATSMLRPNESVVLRLTNEELWRQILSFNQDGTPNEFVFESNVEYTSLANQRISYRYHIKISDDRRIEVIEDGVTNISDITIPVNQAPTVCRNLQDSIVAVDRANFIWEKQGEAQMKGLMRHYYTTPFANTNTPPENTITEETQPNGQEKN